MKRAVWLILLIVLGFAAGSCGGSDDVITIYSGRTSNLIGPLLEDFVEGTGIDVEVRTVSRPTSPS